ncbi:cupin domain-containing protein [Spirosoma sp. BT704]|uniref:Cupin domain-containing protein n=2 Tax=Spirosoma validum TaxID=2771355 RepID=A0A927GHQ0_9BACT|nr:cupin domain-containing protein [Spirosoma validum]
MGGNLAMIELTAGQGSQGPRHVHTREDELFHLIEGQVRFQIGDEIILAHPGQTVLAPKNVPHQFTILTPQARLLNVFTPGNFVEYILAWSQPLAQQPVTVPVRPGPPPSEVMAQRAQQLEQVYGVYFV